MENAALSTDDHVNLSIPSAATGYARIKIAVTSTDDHVDLCITLTTTDYARMMITVSLTGDHVTLYNFGDHRLHPYGERRFIDWRSCKPMENSALSTDDHVNLSIPSVTTDYARIKIAVTSTGDHVDLCITTLTTTDYARMKITVSPTGDHVTLYNFGDHRLHPYGERRFIDRRSC